MTDNDSERPSEKILHDNLSEQDNEVGVGLFPQENNQKDHIVQYSPKQRFYRFNDEIGCGSYKSVYRGHDSDTGREIAWNVIKLTRLPPQQRKRIIEEIAILKNISHNKIINFINAWTNKNQKEMVFITEMVSGGSLKKHLKKIKKPRLKIIKGWCKEILQGLNYLHSNKPNPIIHRDIKCENIFINTNTNEIRIGDLGLAISTKNSYAETLIGTPEFMAPEIFEGKYSTGVDIYAFGMCVLEMATLQTPYQECTSLPQIYKYIEQRIKPRMLKMIELQSLRNFIGKCLGEASQRPSAAELLQDSFFLPDPEDDNKEIRIKEHTVIQQVAPHLEYTLKPEYMSHFKFNAARSQQLHNDNEEQQSEEPPAQAPPDSQFADISPILVSSADLDPDHKKAQAKKSQHRYSVEHYYEMDKLKPIQNKIQAPVSATEIRNRIKSNFKAMYRQYVKSYYDNCQYLCMTKTIHAAELQALKEIQPQCEAENKRGRSKNSRGNLVAEGVSGSGQFKTLLNIKRNPQRPNRIVETLFNDFPVKADCPYAHQHQSINQSGLETKSLFQATYNPSILNNSLYTWMEEIRDPDQDAPRSPSYFQPMSKRNYTDNINTAKFVPQYLNFSSHPSQKVEAKIDNFSKMASYAQITDNFRPKEEEDQESANKNSQVESPTVTNSHFNNESRNNNAPSVSLKPAESSDHGASAERSLNTLLESRTIRNKSPDPKKQSSTPTNNNYYRNLLYSSSVTYSEANQSKPNNPAQALQPGSQQNNSKSYQNTPTSSDVVYTEFKLPSSMVDMIHPKNLGFGNEVTQQATSDKRPPLPHTTKDPNKQKPNKEQPPSSSGNTPTATLTHQTPVLLSTSRLDQPIKPPAVVPPSSASQPTSQPTSQPISFAEILASSLPTQETITKVSGFPASNSVNNVAGTAATASPNVMSPINLVPSNSASSASPLSGNASVAAAPSSSSPTTPPPLTSVPVPASQPLSNSTQYPLKSKSSESSTHTLEAAKQPRTEFPKIDQKIVMQLMTSGEQIPTAKSIQRSLSIKSDLVPSTSKPQEHHNIDLLQLDVRVPTLAPIQINTAKPPVQYKSKGSEESLMPSTSSPPNSPEPTTLTSIQLYRQKKPNMKFPVSKQSAVKEDVMLVQNLLRELTGQKIEAVGVFGHYTEEIVKKYQQALKLKPDGVINQNLFTTMIQQLEKNCKLTEKEKQMKEKSQELQRIRKEKNQESQKLLSKMESQILADDN